MVYVGRHCRLVFNFDIILFNCMGYLEIAGNKGKLIGKAVLGSRDESELIFLKGFEEI